MDFRRHTSCNWYYTPQFNRLATLDNLGSWVALSRFINWYLYLLGKEIYKEEVYSDSGLNEYSTKNT